MRTLEKAIRTSYIDKRNWKQDLYTFLRNYRATPHATTGKSPAELLFGRKMKVTLPSYRPPVSDKDVRHRDDVSKQRMKLLADQHPQRRPYQFQLGDMVLVRQKRKNKLTAAYDSRPYRSSVSTEL